MAILMEYMTPVELTEIGEEAKQQAAHYRQLADETKSPKDLARYAVFQRLANDTLMAAHNQRVLSGGCGCYHFCMTTRQRNAVDAERARNETEETMS